MLPLAVSFLYVCAHIWLMASVRATNGTLPSHAKRLIGLISAVMAWVLHGYSLCSILFRADNLGLSIYAATSIVGWVIAAITVITVFRQPRFAWIGALLLLCAGLSALGLRIGDPLSTEEPLRWALTTHVILAVVAYSLIAIGAVMALVLIWVDRRLHRHQALQALTKLPSVEALETTMFQAITAGFALLTLTLFSGFIFVENLFAQHLIHKTILSCLSWLLLAIVLVQHRRLGWRGKIAAKWVVSGFGALGLAYFGSKFVLESILGKHWG